MEYKIIAIGNSYKKVPFLSKIIEYFSGYPKLEYVCWSRGDASSDSLDSDIEVNVLYSKDPKSRIAMLWSYFVWWIKVFWFCLYRIENKCTVFSSRFDVASAVFCASIFNRNVRYIYFDRDAYHMSYNFSFFTKIITFFEKIVSVNAVIHIVPGFSRDFTNSDNVRILPNTPSKNIFESAILFSKNLKRDTHFTVYVNGWLKSTRGFFMIRSAIKNVNSNIRFILAGDSSNPNIQELSRMANVDYLGHLSSTEALSYYFVSDLVLSFYDPSVLINKKAEPNKWYDCAFSGTRFVTNYGIDTFDFFRNCPGCYSIDYGDSDALVALISQLASKKESGDLNKINPYFLELDLKYWDIRLDEIISESLGVSTDF